MATQSDDDAASRYEKNQMVRRVLIRHSVDLELLSVSCVRSFVYLNGYLRKGFGKSLKAVEVEIVFREIEALPWVRGIIADLEDMVVSNNEGAWSVLMKTPSRAAAISGGDEEYRIDSAKSLEETLEDIERKDIKP